MNKPFQANKSLSKKEWIKKTYAFIEESACLVLKLISFIGSVVTCAWEGGSRFAQEDGYNKYIVTKEEYDEYGFNLCKRKFYN